MILIRRVALKNFLSHENTEIILDEGITVIVGENGAGKTSLIQGMIYALYGARVKGSVRGDKKEELIQVEKDRAKVLIELKNGPDNITIEREIAKGRSQVTARKNNSMIGYSANAVDRVLVREIGVDADLLTSTVVMPQGKIEDILEGNVLMEVLKKVAKVSELDKLEDWGLFREIKLEIENRLEQARQANSDANAKELEKATVLKKIAEDRDQAKRITEDLRKWEERERNLKGLREEMSVTRDKYISLIQKRDYLAKSIQQFKDEIRLDPTEEELKRAERRLDELNEAKVKYEQRDQAMRRLTKSRQRAQEKRKELEKYTRDLERKRELTPRANQYQNLKQELESLKRMEVNERYQRIHGKLENLKSEIEKARERLSNKTRELESIRVELGSDNQEVLERKVEEIKDEISRLTSRMELLKKSIEPLKLAEGGKCPVCGSPLSEEHAERIVQEYSQELQGLIKSRNELSRQLEEVSKRRDRARRLTKEMERINSEVDSLKLEVERRTREREELEKSLEDLRRDYLRFKELERQVTDLERDYSEYLRLSKVNEELVEQIKDEIFQLDTEIMEDENLLEQLGQVNFSEEELRKAERTYKELVSRRSNANRAREMLVSAEGQLLEVDGIINSLNFNEQEFQQTSRELEEAGARVRDLSRKLAELEGSLRRMEETRNSLEREIGELRKRASAMRGLDEARTKLDKLREVLDENHLQRYLMERIVERVTRMSSNFLQSFNLPYVTVEIDRESYEPVAYRRDGREIRVKNLSGGERVALSISLRMGLANVQTNRIGFVIMDEPTAQLDEQRKAELLNIIQRGKEAVRQMIVVTHDQQVKDIAKTVIEIKKDELGKSMVKVIESEV